MRRLGKVLCLLKTFVCREMESHIVANLHFGLIGLRMWLMLAVFVRVFCGLVDLGSRVGIHKPVI